MNTKSVTEIATGGYNQTQHLWMPASQTRPFFLNDPSLWWLDIWGEKYGFKKDEVSEYDFLQFIFNKGHRFEEIWVKENAPHAKQVCNYAWDVKNRSYLIETLRLMKDGEPIILQPALWWAPERIHGVPDILILSSEFKNFFPNLLADEFLTLNAPNLELNDGGYYIPIDLKFTSKLNTKPSDLGMYSTQLRIYAYMVGQIQGIIPPFGYLITRDDLLSPISIPIRSTIGKRLDQDLAEIRDQYLEIKENGDQYRPWTHEIVQYNMKNQKDFPWHDSKKNIAQHKYQGGDPSYLYELNLKNRNELAQQGFPSIQSMLNVDAEKIPLEECHGIGASKAKKIRTILRANREGKPDEIDDEVIPIKQKFEFYVDYEFFNNLNVDFETQWPSLEGCEMVFMIGVGWVENGNWQYKAFIAEEESQAAELKMTNEFVQFLDSKTNGEFINKSTTALYHWTSAEVWQTRHIYERHNLPEEHPLRILPWIDLQKTFFNGNICFPGAWDFGLKEVAQALGKFNNNYNSQWPPDLHEGLQAMVMGWSAYKKPDILNSKEIKLLLKYLEMDCKALLNILSWLRYNIQSSE